MRQSNIHGRPVPKTNDDLNDEKYGQSWNPDEDRSRPNIADAPVPALATIEDFLNLPAVPDRERRVFVEQGRITPKQLISYGNGLPASIRTLIRPGVIRSIKLIKEYKRHGGDETELLKNATFRGKPSDPYDRLMNFDDAVLTLGGFKTFMGDINGINRVDRDFVIWTRCFLQNGNGIFKEAEDPDDIEEKKQLDKEEYIKIGKYLDKIINLTCFTSDGKNYDLSGMDKLIRWLLTKQCGMAHFFTCRDYDANDYANGTTSINLLQLIIDTNGGIFIDIKEALINLYNLVAMSGSKQFGAVRLAEKCFTTQEFDDYKQHRGYVALFCFYLN